MAKECSKSVEILPGPTVEWMVGSIKTSTCRVTKNGRNLASKKVKQPNKTGGDPRMFTRAGEKWRAMTEAQKKPWKELAKEQEFRSGWHAFNSSFFRSVAIHGLEYTMNQELTYIYSDNRQKKAEHLNNSLKRLQKYYVQESFYTETEEMLKSYPVQLCSPHIIIRLEDLTDINNALAMKWLYRTDAVTEYQFYPEEETGSVEKGYYVKTGRPRNPDELYELF